MLAPAGTGATEQERHHWLAGYCKQRTNGTNGLYGALVGQGWDGRTLSGARTVAPPWAPEQERHRWLLRGSGLCQVVIATNIVGAEYLCRISKTKPVDPIQPIRSSSSDIQRYSDIQKYSDTIQSSLSIQPIQSSQPIQSDFF